MKNLAIGIGVGMAILVSVTFVRYQIKETASSYTEDAYMGITRQEYLDKVSNNGQDKESLCAYEYLIDTYGIKETYRMDYRAYEDENDVDKRIYAAIKKCM